MRIQSGSNATYPGSYNRRVCSGLAGNSVSGTGSVTMYPNKRLFGVGEQAQIKIKGPAGWAVRQRNLWQGRSTGETAEGIRGWYVVPNADGSYVIGPDGTFTINLNFGARDVGEWQYEFEFATPDNKSQDQGRSEHGGLNYIPSSQIQGDPLEFAVQGQLDIPPRLDYTAYFAEKHPTEEYYRQYVAMMEQIPATSVKIPNLLRGAIQSSANVADTARQVAIANEQNTVHMWGGDPEFHKWLVASDFNGPHPKPVGYPAARIAYSLQGDTSGLTPGELEWATKGTNNLKSWFDSEVYPPTAGALKQYTASQSAPAGQVATQSSGNALTNAVNSLAPSSATGAMAPSSAQAVFQNFQALIPTSLQQTVAVGGTSIPYWGIALAGVALLYMVNKK